MQAHFCKLGKLFNTRKLLDQEMTHVCGILCIALVRPSCTADVAPVKVFCLLDLCLGMHSFALTPITFWSKLVKPVKGWKYGHRQCGKISLTVSVPDVACSVCSGCASCPTEEGKARARGGFQPKLTGRQCARQGTCKKERGLCSEGILGNTERCKAATLMSCIQASCNGLCSLHQVM